MEEYVQFTCDTRQCIPSLYINPSVIDWFNRILQEKGYSQFIESVWNIKIVNVDFVEFTVKLMQFKSKDAFVNGEIYSELNEFIKATLFEAKLSMPWLPYPNLYTTDDDFDDRIKELKLCGLWNSIIEICDYNSKWIEQKPLKLMKLKDGAFIDRYKDIFYKSINKVKFSLYICRAYSWHQSWYINYFNYNIDYLSIDICASEWKRTDAFQDLNIFDILSLDLALCDANDYLNAYIERVFTREFKFIKSFDKTNKLQHFDLEKYLADKNRYDQICTDLYLYFIYSYGANLKTINWSDHNFKSSLENNIFFFMIVKSIFPNIDVQKNKYISFRSSRVAADEIVDGIKQLKHSNIILDISNYYDFTSTMLTKLLKIEKVIRIEIDVDLLENFKAGHQSEELGLVVIGRKTIRLYSESGGGNVWNVESVIKFLGQFQARILSIVVDNCVIDNFEVFKGLILYSLAFHNMVLSLGDLRKLCRYQENLTFIYFTDCAQFGDYHLIELLEYKNRNLRRISIDGQNAVTINFYFMYAEHQLRANRLLNFQPRNIFPVICMKTIRLFQNITYILNERENKIEVKNKFNEIIDIYDLFDGVTGTTDDPKDMYDFYN